MKDKAIISVFILVLFIYMLIGNTLVLAHGVGGGQDKIVGNHLIDFGYNTFNPTEQESILLKFVLMDTYSKEQIKFTSMELVILNQDEEILFRDDIAQVDGGETSFTYSFPAEGSYIINSKFNNGLGAHIKANFSIDVGRREQSSSGEPSSHSSKNEIFISITDEAYSPNFIIISKGTRVTWINNGKNPNWPASDFHPTHTLYPDSGIVKCGTSVEGEIFDSCHGLEKGDEFSFTFNRVGTWSVHDHLRPGTTMTIKVKRLDKYDLATKQLTLKLGIINRAINQLKAFFGNYKNTLEPFTTFGISTSGVYEPVEDTAAKVKETCDIKKRLDGLDKLACYAEEFEKITLETSTEYASDVLDTLQKIDKTALKCHFIMHGIGWATYKMNSNNVEEALASMSASCSYGGIHGVLEQYILNLPRGKLTKDSIVDVCGENPNPGCLHGMGHVLVVETKDNLDETVELCSAFKSDVDSQRCLNGAYMEHMITGGLAEEGLVSPSRRKFWYTYIDDFEKLCKSLDGMRALACWIEITHASSIKFRDNPKKVFDFCNAAPTFDAIRRCKLHSINGLVSSKKYNLSAIKYACTLKQPNDQNFEEICYQTMVAMKLANLPKKESADVVDFCSSLEPKFHSSCFKKIGSISKQTSISNDIVSAICKNAPAEFKDKCLGK